MQINEGQTATNPNTGERIVYRGGSWQPISGAPARIYGNAKPGQAIDLARGGVALQQDQANLQTEGLDQQLKSLQIDEARAEANERQRRAGQAQQSQRLRADSARSVLDAIGQARGLVNDGWATGWGQRLLGSVPETNARDLQSVATTIKANLGFDALQAMRDASPTGGALGQVAVQEFEALQAAVANLDPMQSQDQFTRNLDTIERRYQNILGLIEGNGPQAPVAPRTVQGTSEAPELPPEVATAWDAFIADNPRPTAQQIQQFAQQYGLGVANAEQIAATAGTGIVGSEGAIYKPDISDARGQGGVGETIDAGIRGAADVVTFGFADEASAAASSLFGRGTYDQNLARERAIDAYDQENSPVSRGIGQLTGAVALPFGAGARTPLEFARVGAISGGAYGVGSGVEQGDRLSQGAQGALAGGLGGYALSRALPVAQSALSRLRPTAGAEASALAQSANRLGVDVLPADVGGPTIRGATAAAAQMPASQGAVARAAQRTVDQSQGARDRIAGGVGEVLDREGAGEAARRGADAFRVASSQRATALYDRAAELAGDARITPTRALEALDRHIAEMSEVPGGADGLAVLQRLRSELADQSFTVRGVRGMRTSLRDQFANNNLRGSDLERRVFEVVDAAGEDIAQNLAEAGLDNAAQAYAAADQFWRARISTIDEVIKPLIGGREGGAGYKTGEQVLSSIEGATQRRGGQLERLLGSMPAEERATVQATLIGRMGNSSSGQQNAAGDAFSLNTFLTQWDKMTPRARRAVFPGETMEALNDLARVASGVRESGRFANRSNTSGAVGWGLTGGAAWAAPLTTAFATISQYAAGRMLASPRFARWLADAPREGANPTPWINRLNVVANRLPALRGEIQQLQQHLLSAQAPSGRVLASDEQRPEEQDAR